MRCVFQSTPPREGATWRWQAVSSAIVVSIHAPARGATTPTAVKPRHAVSIHAPARGGDSTAAAAVAGIRSFNPRARARGPGHPPPSNPRPRAGATVHGSACRGLSVSIHAPARGATDSQPVCGRRPKCFNPRPRAGGDATSRPQRETAPKVSIHAPARGRDMAAKPAFVAIAMGFNPRPRAGATQYARAGAVDESSAEFQSTPPREGRPAASQRHRDMGQCFNPRTRAGCDDCGFNPPRGDCDLPVRCFNPRPRAGATP